MNDIYLNDWLTPAAGRTLTIKRQQIERKERAASGKLCIDKKIKKRTFVLTYSYISGPDLDMFESLLDLKTPLVMQISHSYKATETYNVNMIPFESERLLCIDDTLWEGFTCELEEY
jgi:hypothetical protein